MLSTHAEKRSQQRGIPPLVVDLLLEFGAREHDGHGAEICYFDRRAKKRLQAYTGGMFGQSTDLFNSYAVVSGDSVITVGTRFKRINHR